MWGYIKQRNIYLKQTIPTATSVSIIKQIARELRHDKIIMNKIKLFVGKLSSINIKKWSLFLNQLKYEYQKQPPFKKHLKKLNNILLLIILVKYNLKIRFYFTTILLI